MSDGSHTQPILSAENVTLSYGPTQALRGASVAIGRGEIVVLMGKSGSGKTSLLYCLAGILSPDSGTVRFDGLDLDTLDDSSLSRLRRESFGFVFQFGDLVPELTIQENVELPLRLLGESRKRARTRAVDLLERFGIASLGGRQPGQLSGGQAQRAAIARALVHRPAVVFADEPTGSLDSENKSVVLQELAIHAREAGASVVLVTHEEDVAAVGDRRLAVMDGLVNSHATV